MAGYVENGAHEFLLRDARMDDLDDICELSVLLNTLNFPAKRSELEKVIAASERSFSLKANELGDNSFLFVLENREKKVIGTSQIFAKHGTLDFPHLYFDVKSDERYSSTLKKYFRHKTLRLGQNFDGPTEVGSLVLHEKYRGLPERLGRNLSYVRFLFMAMQPTLFSNQVLAELLPPLGPGFESALWEAIGRKFTGIDYYEADMLSRENKEFIKTLFPSDEIHVSLLPPAAQEVIGQVGRNSQAAAKLLSKIGFRFSQRVDPFDGGPHFEADRDDISLIRDAIHARLSSSPSQLAAWGNEAFQEGLIAVFRPENPSGQRFSSVLAPYRYDEDEQQIYLGKAAVNSLKTSLSEHVSLINLTV